MKRITVRTTSTDDLQFVFISPLGREETLKPNWIRKDPFYNGQFIDDICYLVFYQRVNDNDEFLTPYEVTCYVNEEQEDVFRNQFFYAATAKDNVGGRKYSTLSKTLTKFVLVFVMIFGWFLSMLSLFVETLNVGERVSLLLVGFVTVLSGWFIFYNKYLQ